MKRYPEFVYNAIDKQNIVFANQLKMSDWNNIINVLKTQANANTTFLETWTRWFFGPKEYIDEDEYAIVPEDYTNYFDYLTGMFKEIDTRIKNEINDRVAADNTLREYIDLKHGIAMETIYTESEQRIIADDSLREYTDLKHGSAMDAISEERNKRDSQDILIRDEIKLEETTRIQEDEKLRTSLEVETNERRSNDNYLQGQIDEEVDRSKAEDKKLQDQISTNKADIAKKISIDFTDDLLQASTVHKDDSIIIRCTDTTYTITVSYLAELLGTGVNLFKGYYTSLEGLIAKHPSAEEGSYAFVGTKDDEQYHMYIWDALYDGGRWEETISGQYVGTSTFDTFQQRLQEGRFHVGAIKANVETSEETDPLLVNIEINGETFTLPSMILEFLSDNTEGAYELGSIKIGNSIWNIAKLSEVLNRLVECTNNANTYTDTKVSDTLANAKAYADTKATATLNSANSHSDTKDTETLNSANTYADTKDTETLNSAKSYADTKGTEALNAAKAYADAIKKAILGENISETFDTLKEIQDWINGDGVNATELSQAVANKQKKLTPGNGISISEDGVISISYPDGDEEVY